MNGAKKRPQALYTARDRATGGWRYRAGCLCAWCGIYKYGIFFHTGSPAPGGKKQVPLNPDGSEQPAQPAQPTTKPSVTPGNNNSGNNQPAVTKPVAKKLARVAKVKAKNNKAKTVKVTWKKVANAKKYEVKVGNKTYTAKKATLTVKKLKKGKTYKIKVRAKATGYTTGAWSKTVKVKIKK